MPTMMRVFSCVGCRPALGKRPLPVSHDRTGGAPRAATARALDIAMLCRVEKR